MLSHLLSLIRIAVDPDLILGTLPPVHHKTLCTPLQVRGSEAYWSKLQMLTKLIDYKHCSMTYNVALFRNVNRYND